MEQATVELGKLKTGKTLWQYKEEISRLTGVHPMFIRIEFEKNKEKTKIIDVTPSITKAGVVQKALSIGLVGVEIRENCDTQRKGVEIEARAYFLPDVVKIGALVDELLRVARHMTPEDVGAIAKDMFRLRSFMNRAHRSVEDGSLNDRQKPYLLELAITTALTRVLGDATGYGLAQLDQSGESDAAIADHAVDAEKKIEATGEGVDGLDEAESLDDIEMKRDLAKSTIMAAVETLGWPEAKSVLSFAGDREDFEYTLETVDFPILAEEAEKLVAKVNAVFTQEEEHGDKGTEEKPDPTVP